MTSSDSQNELYKLANQLEKDLLAMYGSPLITGEQLRSALGFRSIEALRQALTRKVLPIEVFTIANRKGRFALVKDIALWLATQRIDNIELKKTKDMPID